MKIVLNNTVDELEEGPVTVTRFLELKKYTFRMRIVKINNVLIPREKYDATLIREGDDVQMLYLMSGG